MDDAALGRGHPDFVHQDRRADDRALLSKSQEGGMSQQSAKLKLTSAIRRVILHYQGNLGKFFEDVRRKMGTS